MFLLGIVNLFLGHIDQESSKDIKTTTSAPTKQECNHNLKFAKLGPEGFKDYISCENGNFVQKSCPKNSNFFFFLQCCVQEEYFPCSSNCIQGTQNFKNSEILLNNGLSLHDEL